MAKRMTLARMMSGNCNRLMAGTSLAKCKRIPFAPEVVVFAATEMTELKRIKCCRWPLTYVDEVADDDDVDDDDERENDEDKTEEAADEDADAADSDALLSRRARIVARTLFSRLTFGQSIILAMHFNSRIPLLFMKRGSSIWRRNGRLLVCSRKPFVLRAISLICGWTVVTGA